MTDFVKHINDVTTGEIIVEPMTDEEIAARETEIAEALAARETKAAEAEAKAAAKAAAQAKLEALGLTVEDLQALGL